MRLTIERTDDLLELDGVEVRRWVGTLESGGTVHMYVHRLAVDESDTEALRALDLAGHTEVQRPSLMLGKYDYAIAWLAFIAGSHLALPENTDVREILEDDIELAKRAAGAIVDVARTRFDAVADQSAALERAIAHICQIARASRSEHSSPTSTDVVG